MQTILLVPGSDTGFWQSKMGPIAGSLGLTSLPIQVTSDPEYWAKAHGNLRIISGDEPPSDFVEIADQVWPGAATVAASDAARTEIRNFVKDRILPASKTGTINVDTSGDVTFTKEDIKKCLLLLSDATAPFSFQDGSGLTWRVSNDPSAPGKLSFGDLASVAMVTLLHDATGIKIEGFEPGPF